MPMRPPTHVLFLDFLSTLLSEMNIHVRVGMHSAKEPPIRRRPLHLVHAFYYETTPSVQSLQTSSLLEVQVLQDLLQ